MLREYRSVWVLFLWKVREGMYLTDLKKEMINMY